MAKLKLINITPEMLIELIKPACGFTLPGDVSIDRITDQLYPARKLITLVLKSSTFPHVPEGKPIPAWND